MATGGHYITMLLLLPVALIPYKTTCLKLPPVCSGQQYWFHGWPLWTGHCKGKSHMRRL